MIFRIIGFRFLFLKGCNKIDGKAQSFFTCPLRLSSFAGKMHFRYFRQSLECSIIKPVPIYTRFHLMQMSYSKSKK